MKARDLKELASAWLRAEYPGALIVEELSVSTYGGALIDVAAITHEMIVGVEIKGEGDSPARLELQGLVYGRVAKKMWLLADESIREKCSKKRPRGWGDLEIHEGEVRPAPRYRPDEHYSPPYEPDQAYTQRHLCAESMLGTLWADELAQICRGADIRVNGRMRVLEMTDAITESLPVPKIHDWMIRLLRQRKWLGAKAHLNKQASCCAAEGCLL